MASDSQLASNDVLNYHLMEAPDSNRFTSSPISTRDQVTMATSNTTTCSKDILCTTQFYLPAEDSEKQLVLVEDVMERREEETNSLRKRIRGKSMERRKEETNSLRKRGKGDILSELPPLPLEEDLFSPPVDKSNRKERNIKVVAAAVLSLMPEKGKIVMKLDELAKKLGTDIKRVYTICNVLEALRITVRRGMNVYEWQGWQVMMKTLGLLRQMGEQQNILGQLAKTTQVAHTEMRLNIGMMTEKLLMMFLVIPQPKVLALPVASSIIHGSDLTTKKRKISMQQLTNISNTLLAVKLLMKVQVKVGDNKKCYAYQYIGPELDRIETISDPGLTKGGDMTGEGNSREGEKIKEKAIKKTESSENENGLEEEMVDEADVEYMVSRNKVVSLVFFKEGMEKIVDL